VARHDLLTIGRRELPDYRRTTVGFVRQQTSRNLLPYLTALENVMLPMAYARVPRSWRAARAGERLGMLGVAGCRDRRPVNSPAAGSSAWPSIAARAAGREHNRGMSEVSEGGDPVCWLSQVCDACGGMRSRPAPAPCERCGAVPESGQEEIPPAADPA